MYFYQGKLKVVFAVGGIALALLPCFQQTHAICRLFGCLEPALEIPVAAVALQGSSCGGCCEKSEIPCEDPPQDCGDELPCGPNCCWFTQSADPREAPRSSSEVAEASIYLLHATVSTSISEIQSSIGDRCSFADESLPSLSAVETCAVLCRFLT